MMNPMAGGMMPMNGGYPMAGGGMGMGGGYPM